MPCFQRAVLLLLASAYVGVSSQPELVALESVGDLPTGWSVSGPSAREESIELMFAVKQRNIAKLHEELMRVSSPSSPDYGMHLSNDEVQALTAPDPAHINAVLEFAKSFGVEAHQDTPNSDFVVVKVPVAVAENMLSAKYVSLQHAETGASIDRALTGYSLPADVAAAVDFVAPTVHIPGVHRPSEPKGQLGSSIGLNTPKNLRELYNVGDTVGKAPTNKQAVTAFIRQFYSKSALESFWKDYCNPANVSFTCGKGDPKTVGDGTTGFTPGVEAMLDIEYITAMGGNIDTEFWGFAGKSPDNPQNEPFMKWLTQMSKTSDADVPKLFSTSYGEGESTWSNAAATRLNAEFMKAGARGITLLYASGDSGASCKGGKFTPNMPASSPYVTAVGGTQPGLLHPKPGAESAIGLASGGFSNYWPTPDYQKTAVAGYLKQPGIPSASTYGYNVSGRGFPDIAAQATGFPVAMGLGISQIVAGTSCASPTAAGIIGLLNDLRLQSGKSTLGFLNPMLYSQPAAFNDITKGSSSGCGFASKGWPATKGWDAVTGLGTLDYQKLSKVVESLPAGRAPKVSQIVV